MAYVGRFAPSPTGPLHFGSLVAALASWLDARSAGGRWLVRMEDLDLPRVMRGADSTILRQLESFGLAWDGPVEHQSQRSALYQEALLALGAHAYPCACTRRELEDSSLAIDGSRIYPGTCRSGIPPGKTARAVRLKTEPAVIAFTDRAQGELEQSVEKEVGDFILRRADGLFAYQLAVVVDDAEQGVTHVVRGADLLDSTARQIYLQGLLGYATPQYLHVPVATNAAGEKLSKQTHALDAAPDDVPSALRFLGLDPPVDVSPRDLPAWAMKRWNVEAIPRRRVALSD
ncbi:MAG: tRNA glutamyl-Q(34) synthetase GluQRS [Burkholderiales bacterium]